MVEVFSRTRVLLGGLCLVAFANGLFLGLSLYAVLVTILGLLGIVPPASGLALLGGTCAGIGLLVLGAVREYQLRAKPQAYLPGALEAITDSDLLMRFNRLVAKSSLTVAPSLHRLYVAQPNAFTFGRSREDAAIVLTKGAIDSLSPAQVDAILAHELARVESEDVRVVGFADAISSCLNDLGRLKGTVLWGPKRTAVDLLPFALVSLLGVVILELFPLQSQSQMNFGEVIVLLLLLALYLGYLLLWLASAVVSGRGIAQLLLFVAVLGPLTLVEWILAPPTAVVISRLVSRTRIYEADWRAGELVGNRTEIVSLLRALHTVESSIEDDWQGQRRFALLVKPHAQSGYRAYLERVTSTHPLIADRIGQLQAPVRTDLALA